MTYGKTKQSAVLYKEPSLKSTVLDELEPNYPLRLLGYRYLDEIEWCHCVALIKGPRDEEQTGWIKSRLIEVDSKRAPQPQPALPQSPNVLSIIAIGLGFVIALALAIIFAH